MSAHRQPRKLHRQRRPLDAEALPSPQQHVLRRVAEWIITGHGGAKQNQVLDGLRFFPDVTNAELAAYLKWPVIA